jgi:hypothetical protein
MVIARVSQRRIPMNSSGRSPAIRDGLSLFDMPEGGFFKIIDAGRAVHDTARSLCLPRTIS